MIRLENVSKYYHSDGNVVLGLHKVNLEFKMGEFVAITGESGSGKSTLLNVISGIDSYEDGEVYFNNQETSYYDESDWENYRRNNIGFVFQNYNLVDSYTVLENVESALIINGVSRKERKRRAIEIINSVGLGNHLKHKGTKLSGGEKQRLSIARAIAKDAPVIVADEPTGNLDSETGKQIMDILLELSKTKLVVMVTHNYELVENYVSRLVRIYDGMIVENKVFTEPSIPDEINVNLTKVPVLKKATPFALWNFKNQPKTTILSLLVSLVTTLIICFLFAAYLEAKNQNSFSHNYMFNDSPLERLIIKKIDKNIFEESDYEKISKLSNIDLIIKQDIIYRQYISLQRNTLFPSHLDQYGGTIRHVNELKNKTLLYGRMPEAYNEVVISAGRDVQEYLNRSFTPYLNVLHGQVSIPDNITIVGIVKSEDFDYQDRVYFTDNMLTKLNDEALFRLNYKRVNIDPIPEYFQHAFTFDPNLKSNEVILNVRSAKEYSATQLTKGSNVNLRLGSKIIPLTIKEISFDTLSEFERYQESMTITLSKELYDEIYNLENLQHTILVKNHTQIKKTIKDLESLGYYAFSPRSVVKADLFTTIQNVFFTIFYSGIIFIIYLISYIIVKTIFSSRNRDHVILKSIGLDSSSVKMINIIQISTYFLLSFIILIPTVIYVSKKNTVFRMIFQNFRATHYCLLLIINIFLGVFIALKVNKSIHKKSILSSMKAE